MGPCILVQSNLVCVLVLILFSNMYPTWLCLTLSGVLALALTIRDLSRSIDAQQLPAMKEGAHFSF